MVERIQSNYTNKSIISGTSTVSANNTVVSTSDIAVVGTTKPIGVNETFQKNSDANFQKSLDDKTKKAMKDELKRQYAQLQQDLDKAKKENGFIGKSWDWIKNTTGLGQGSNKTQKDLDVLKKQLDELEKQPNKLSEVYKNITGKEFNAQELEKFKKGETTLKAKQAVKNYKDGQKASADIVADVVSGVAAFGAFSLATGVGIAAAPFTGGASLGLVAAGLAIAGAAGAATKVAIKGADAATGGRKYDSFGYDLATGGVNGLLAPVTAGIGGAIGKTVASRVGVTAVREGGEILLKESIENTAKGAVTRTLLTTNISYTGGNVLTRGLAIGSDMAANGTVAGATDSGVRYLAGDTENKSLSGFAIEVGGGALGGLVAAPIIGGGMRLASKGAGKVTNEFGDKITSAYTKAKTAFLNVPVVENPDAEIVKGLGGVAKQAQSLVNDFNARNTSVAGFANENAEAISNLTREAVEHAQSLPNTQLYKQLGDLPDRGKRVYATLTADVSKLDEAAKTARHKILTGHVQEGIADLNKYYAELDAFNGKLQEQISQSQAAVERSGIAETAEVLTERLNKRMSTPEFASLSKEAQAQTVIEDSNILFSKFIQTFSSDESLPKNIRTFFKQFTSNATTSRNINQAQVLADELYGNGSYTLLKSFGAGTIGETYLAKDKNGKEVVIKMLKNGVTPEKFAADRKAFTGYISEFVSDPTEKEYKLKMINGLFDSWDRELNFGLEAQGAKEMAIGAKRFNVAQTLQVGTKNGQNVSIVMEKADGIGLDSLIDMIRFRKENPTDFLTKSVKNSDGKEMNPWIRNAGFVEQNPLLASSEDWMKDLSKAYQKAQNEQALFVSKSGNKTVHADPHGGNVFAAFDATGKPKITYIDTGNVVKRTNSEVIQDIGLSLNMMIGNSKGVAAGMLEGATFPSGANKAQLTERFAQLLDEKLFKAGVNIKNVAYTQTTIDSIMKELNIIPNANNSNLMKATLQRIKTSRELSTVSGVTLSKKGDIKDLGIGILKALKTNPNETMRMLRPIIKWAYQNNDQAMITFFQMLMKTAQTQQAV